MSDAVPLSTIPSISSRHRRATSECPPDMDSSPRLGRFASLFAALAVVAGTIGPLGTVEIASAATAKAKVDPLLKAEAAKDAGAVTPVIIERTDDRAAVDLVKAK